MIDQTIPLPELTAGMARCLREWILPHLEDPMARTQAETLAMMIESIPGSVSAQALQAIQADSDASRDVLRQLGESVEEGSAQDVDGAVRENSALKSRLLALADRIRGDESAQAREQLAELQRLFVESMQREIEMVKRGADFAAMTSQEDAARKS